MKKLFQLMILIFLFVSTTSVAIVQASTSDETYLNELSDFYIVNQNMVSPEGSALVPLGVVRGINDVYYVDFEYEVLVKKDMDLQVLIEDLVFTNELLTEDDLLSTFNFEISQQVVEEVRESDQLFGEMEDAVRVIVTVRVSMNIPQTQELFSHLIGGQLGFEVYFFAADL